DPSSFAGWAEASLALGKGGAWVAAIVLAAAALATAVYGFSVGMFWPLMLVLILEYGMQRTLQPRAVSAISGLPNAEGLLLFSQVLERLERERFAAPRLAMLGDSLRGGPQTASRAIRRLAQVVYWIDAREGLFVRTIDLPLLYTIHVGYTAE